MKKDLNLLTEAKTLCQSGEYLKALKKLLQQFRLHPSTQVSDLINRLGLSIASRSATVSTLVPEQLAKIPKAKQPEVLSTALGLVTTGTMKQAADRLDIITQWELDPRTDRAIIEWMKELKYQSGGSRKFWSRVFKRLKKARDPSVADALAELIPTNFDGIGSAMKSWLTERSTAALTILTEQTNEHIVLSDEGIACVEEIGELIPQVMLPKREQLLNAVFDDPFDDDIKLVYADFLLETGDPHGEFIQLQFAKLSRELSTAEQKKEKALIDKHWRDFVGPLENAILRDGIQFEKGFLSRCVTKNFGPKIKSVFDCPYWATVTAVVGPPDLLASPVMKSLQE